MLPRPVYHCLIGSDFLPLLFESASILQSSLSNSLRFFRDSFDLIAFAEESDDEELFLFQTAGERVRCNRVRDRRVPAGVGSRIGDSSDGGCLTSVLTFSSDHSSFRLNGIGLETAEAEAGGSKEYGRDGP